MAVEQSRVLSEWFQIAGVSEGELRGIAERDRLRGLECLESSFILFIKVCVD